MGSGISRCFHSYILTDHSDQDHFLWSPFGFRITDRISDLTFDSLWIDQGWCFSDLKSESLRQIYTLLYLRCYKFEPRSTGPYWNHYAGDGICPWTMDLFVYLTHPTPPIKWNLDLTVCVSIYYFPRLFLMLVFWLLWHFSSTLSLECR